MLRVCKRLNYKLGLRSVLTGFIAHAQLNRIHLSFDNILNNLYIVVLIMLQGLGPAD